MQKASDLSRLRITVQPTYGYDHRSVFAYYFDAAISKAPSDEGAVSEAD